MMKYAINHPWKFRNVRLAFVAGLMQFTISLVIEVSNVYVLLANSETQFDIVSNFVIMLVVADFDNYFYSVRNPDHISRMITEDKFAHIFTWETSTSYDAKAEIPENELKPEMVLLKEEQA